MKVINVTNIIGDGSVNVSNTDKSMSPCRNMKTATTTLR